MARDQDTCFLGSLASGKTSRFQDTRPSQEGAREVLEQPCVSGAPHTHSCVHTSLRSPPSVLDGTPGGGAGQRVHVQHGDRFNLLLRCLMTRVVLFMET